MDPRDAALEARLIEAQIRFKQGDFTKEQYHAELRAISAEWFRLADESARNSWIVMAVFVVSVFLILVLT